jgi:intein/homing endonuclease
MLADDTTSNSFLKTIHHILYKLNNPHRLNWLNKNLQINKNYSKFLASWKVIFRLF